VHKIGKDDILRGRKKYKIVYKQGTKYRGKILRCLVLKTASGKLTRKEKFIFGISINHKVRLSVERNRIKRIIRESYRKYRNKMITSGEESAYSNTFLFIYRPMGNTVNPIPSFNEIDNDVKYIISQIIHASICK
jgi:ribonuclease P protein component